MILCKVGATAYFEVQFFSLTGAPLTGATVTVNIVNPSNVVEVSGGAATELTFGRYAYSYIVDTPGRWVADFNTTHADADRTGLSRDAQAVDVATLAVRYYITLGKEIA